MTFHLSKIQISNPYLKRTLLTTVKKSTINTNINFKNALNTDYQIGQTTKDNNEDKMTWIAHANFSVNKDSTLSSYHQGHLAVRKLLNQLLSYLNIHDVLIEKEFPYFLYNTGYYVCFSHSTNQCAVTLSSRPTGIDIETRDVSWRVVQRYFHQNEIDWLGRLATTEKQLICNQLWEIKECLIKINQGTLTLGMGVDLSFLIERLETSLIYRKSISMRASNSVKLNHYEKGCVFFNNGMNISLTKDESLKIINSHVNQDTPVLTPKMHSEQENNKNVDNTDLDSLDKDGLFSKNSTENLQTIPYHIWVDSQRQVIAVY